MRQIYIGKIAVLTLLLFFIEFTSAFSADISTTSQGGKWTDVTTWVGGVVPTKTDHVIITSAVTANGQSYSTKNYEMADLTVNSGGKIIREVGNGGLSYLTISGTLINNGEIVDYNDYFDIHIKGNVINNGKLKPRYLYTEGDKQTISGSGSIECRQLYLNNTDAILNAGSDLIFKNCRISSSISSTNQKLNMGIHSLSMYADSIKYDSYYGSVSSAAQLSNPVIFEGTGKITADNAIIGSEITGSVQLMSSSYAFISDLIVIGNFTIADGSNVSSYKNLQHLTIRGNFTNYGSLNKDTVRVNAIEFSPRTMYLYINGDINNLGSTGISTIYPITNGKTISLQGNYDANVYIKQSEGTDKPGGKVVINTEVNIAGKLDNYAELEIMKGGTLNLLSKTLSSPIYVSPTDGKLINKGNMYRYHRVNDSWSYRTFTGKDGMFCDFELRTWDTRIEGVDITVHNGQTYPNLPGSTKRWWHLEPVGDGKVTGYTLKLYYDETMLNGQKEENLKVYRSTDEGKNWEVVSVNEFSVIDTVLNTITVGRWDKPTSMMSEFGDFVISAGDGSVPVESSILVDMVGRPNVRIGAPNPFTIHVYNVTDYRTSPIMLAMAVSEDIRFKEVRLPYDGGVDILPVDSISDPDDLTQVFFIPYLEPNEHYSFEVIVYGITDGLKSASENLVTLTLGGFFGHVAEDEATDYFVDKVGEAIDLDKAEKEEYARGLHLTVNQLKTEKQEYGKTVTTIRHVAKYTVKKISDTNLITKIIYGAGEKIEAVYKIKDSLRRRLFHWFYKEVGLYGVEEKVASGKQVNGKLVKSWDPNEMIGPAGYGEKNFITSIPSMNYMINFENKKEATAAAYRVQIIDTLSAVFDPETVKFLETSHSGTQYNWKTERTGNILKWDIEGIELPPNVTPPEGEGFVSFSVEPVEGLSSGSVFENRATIIFDMNEPIMTNTWQNVLDTNSPHSIMNPISYIPGDSLINLSCNGYDDENGSGINKYMFYSSINSGPFSLIGESFENLIQYPVSKDERNSYRFYAITTDNVDNLESSLPALVELKSFPLASKSIENPTEQLKIYPNPTTGIFAVDFLSENQTVVDFQLYSVTGQLLKNERIGLFESGKHRFNIDISDIKQGVYFAKVLRNNKAETFKLVKE